MFYNFDDVFIAAKMDGQLDEVYNRIIESKNIDDLDGITYIDDVIMAYNDLDKIKEDAKFLYSEYKE
jgi:hypothetical protein